MYKILKVSDGTATVNLLNLQEGYQVQGARQKVAQLKAGGSWQQSAMSDGGRLIHYAYDNVTEEYPLAVLGQAKADATGLALEVLQMLCVQVHDYWTHTWHENPVWIEAQAHGEPGARYAILHTAEMPDIGDIYQDGFDIKATLADLQLQAVRGHWGHTPPKTGDAIGLSYRRLHSGHYSGNVDSTEARETSALIGEVFHQNLDLQKQIDTIYTYTALGGWVGNLAFAGVPYYIGSVGLAPVLNDFTVFGIAGAAATRNGFNALVFDVIPRVLPCVYQFEWWNGAGWTVPGALWHIDITQSLTIAGINNITWNSNNVRQNGNLNAIPGAPGGPNIQGYWVRWRVNTPGGTAAQQQHREVYTPTWGGVEVRAADVDGSIDAVIKMTDRAQGENTMTYGMDGDMTGDFNRIIGGLRTDSRGYFVPYFNIGGGSPAGTSILNWLGLNNDVDWPPITYGLWSPAGDVYNQPMMGVRFQSTDWHGRYRIFARVKQVGGAAGDMSVYGILQSTAYGLAEVRGPTRYLSQLAVLELIELGEFALPGLQPYEGNLRLDMMLRANHVPAGVDADLVVYDMVFIPVDEFAFEIRNMDTWYDGVTYGAEMYADSLVDPKRPIRSTVYDWSGPELQSYWRTIAGSPMILRPQVNQTLHFTYSHIDYTTGLEHVPQFLTNTVKIEAMMRYLGLRRV